MRRIGLILQWIMTMPLRLFSKVSVFSVVLASKIDRRSAVRGKTKLNRVRVGKYSYIAANTTITQADIGNFCCIAQHVLIGGGAHPTDWVSASPVFYRGRNVLKKHFARHPFEVFRQTVIGNDVWIATGAKIRSGVHIGDGAVIGMGAVVTHDVGPYEVWAGVPARLIRRRFDDETCERLLATAWWNWDDRRLAEYAPVMNDVPAFLERAELEITKQPGGNS